MFKPKEFVNPLTMLIAENPNCPLYEFLLHPELGPAVKNEANGIINYLEHAQADSLPEEKNLVKLARYALTYEWKKDLPEDLVRKYRLCQPSRNAATVLSAPNRKLNNLLRTSPEGKVVCQRVTRFISPNYPELNLDSILAGHFQRIIEALFRYGYDWIPTHGDNVEGEQEHFIRDLIDFCIEHVDILSYQQILFHLPIDFASCLNLLHHTDDDLEAAEKHIIEVLIEAARNTVAIHDITRADSDFQQKNKTVAPPKNTILVLPVGPLQRKEQPVNHKRQPIPPPPNVKPETRQVPVYHKINKQYETWMNERKRRLLLDKPITLAKIPEEQAKQLKNCQLHAYLLLNAVHLMVTENPELISVLQRMHTEPNDPTILEYLLFIGIFSDESSMVSIAAMKLVRLIAYGIEPDDHNLWEIGDGADQGKRIQETSEEFEGIVPKYDDLSYQRLVSEYAPFFAFSHPVTAQMIAAFPIFWNYRYADQRPLVNFKYKKLEYVLRAPAGYEDDPNIKWIYVRPQGLTPLELFGHLLIFDPAASEALNREILTVLKWYNTACRKIREPDEYDQIAESPRSFYEYQIKVLKADVVFLDFIRTKFPYNTKYPMADMHIVTESFPMDPTNAFFREEASEKHRCPLNGAIAAFAAYWQNAGFLSLKEEYSPMIDDKEATIPDLALETAGYLAIVRNFQETKGGGPAGQSISVGQTLLAPKSKASPPPPSLPTYLGERFSRSVSGYTGPKAPLNSQQKVTENEVNREED